MTNKNPELETNRVKRIIEKYPYGLTYQCYQDIKLATGCSNKDIAAHFGIGLCTFNTFKDTHEKVFKAKGIK